MQPIRKNRAGGLWSLGVGAGLMYFLDPDRGKRRRSSARGRIERSLHDLRDNVDAGIRDLRHRAIGTVAKARAVVSPERVPDKVLAERVRSAIGRDLSHPKWVEVTAQDGVVRLHGQALADEIARVVQCAEDVRGVKSVVNELRAYTGVPEGQPLARRRKRVPELLQVNWTPGVRILVGSAGVVLSLAGIRRGGLARAPLSVVGAGMFARAVTNMPLKRIIGLGAERRGISFHKTFEVKAPIDQVFDFWSHFENFPRFMEHVREVTVKDGVSHWKVAGPLGTVVEWDAEVTELVPRQVFAWRTLPQAKVGHEGIVHFEETPQKTTRLDIRLSYNPPGGAVGHVVASLFHADPKSALDDDMVRLKSLLERGKATAHGETVTRDELAT
ncbi:MAG: BON domain-containing protein [Deltaproteobacteria bacterium]|nr:BON domain-containing protein [Deltaproteobacteria bacterium]